MIAKLKWAKTILQIYLPTIFNVKKFHNMAQRYEFSQFKVNTV